MRQLWAPWRLQYVESASDGSKAGCPLCSIPAASYTDADAPSGTADLKALSLLLYKGESVSVIMNRYPYSNGHLLLSPLNHTSDLNSISGETSKELFMLTARSVDILKESMKPDGFNIGMNLGKAAGAGIDDHLHMHIVPRWNGDSNFMPVLSEVRVMPEHLQATYARLKPFFDSL